MVIDLEAYRNKRKEEALNNELLDFSKSIDVAASDFIFNKQVDVKVITAILADRIGTYIGSSDITNEDIKQLALYLNDKIIKALRRAQNEF